MLYRSEEGHLLIGEVQASAGLKQDRRKVLIHRLGPVRVAKARDRTLSEGDAVQVVDKRIHRGQRRLVNAVIWPEQADGPQVVQDHHLVPQLLIRMPVNKSEQADIIRVRTESSDGLVQ